ncbi:MAG: ATP-binding protein [Rhodobacter sp.]|nr:ATP-binding protein [Rhodobacter sp.]
MAQQALDRSEQRFAKMTESIPGAVMVNLHQTDGRHSVPYISAGCRDLWEVNAADIQNDASLIWDMIHPDDLAAVEAEIAQSIAQERQWNLRWRITTPSGAEKWLHGYGTPERQTDGSTVFSGFVVDVTGQVETERGLHESRELLHEAQKMDALGKLTGGVAHDFNNLLSVIVGNLELLREDPDIADRIDLIDQAIKASFRGSSLTRQLLAYARRAQLQPAVLNPAAVVAEMESMLRRTLPANIALRIDGPGTAPSIRADRSQLETAILNLVINACDAMDQGGSLTIDIRQIEVADDMALGEGEHMAPGLFTVIAVSDTGHGMAPEHAAHAFDPFFTTKPVGRGTGLGLSTVLGFTRQSGGTTKLSSEVGRGTSVRMYFPAAEADAASAVEGRTPPAPLHILLVEDEVDVLRMLKRQVGSMGHQVTTADSGDAALRMIEDGLRPNVLLTDVVMPGRLQGPDLARRATEQVPELRVMFISGYPSGTSPDELGPLADAPVLSKPVRKSELLNALAEFSSSASGPAAQASG